MLSGSILGKAYSYWLCSRCFALCAAVASFFARAWEGSLIRRLCVRRSRLGSFCEGSAVCGLFSSLRSAVISLSGTVSRAFAPARGGSLFARAAAGSRILSFEDLFGLFLLLMFAVPLPTSFLSAMWFSITTCLIRSILPLVLLTRAMFWLIATLPMTYKPMPVT